MVKMLDEMERQLRSIREIMERDRVVLVLNEPVVMNGPGHCDSGSKRWPRSSPATRPLVRGV